MKVGPVVGSAVALMCAAATLAVWAWTYGGLELPTRQGLSFAAGGALFALGMVVPLAYAWDSWVAANRVVDQAVEDTRRPAVTVRAKPADATVEMARIDWRHAPDDLDATTELSRYINREYQR